MTPKEANLAAWMEAGTWIKACDHLDRISPHEHDSPELDVVRQAFRVWAEHLALLRRNQPASTARTAMKDVLAEIRELTGRDYLAP